MVHNTVFLASAIATVLFSSCVARPQIPFGGGPLFPGLLPGRSPLLPTLPLPPGGLLRPRQLPLLQPPFQAPLVPGPLFNGQQNPLRNFPDIASALQQAAGNFFNLGSNLLPNSSSSGSGPLSLLTSPLQSITSLFNGGSGGGSNPLQALSSLSSFFSGRGSEESTSV